MLYFLFHIFFALCTYLYFPFSSFFVLFLWSNFSPYPSVLNFFSPLVFLFLFLLSTFFSFLNSFTAVFSIFYFFTDFFLSFFLTWSFIPHLLFNYVFPSLFLFVWPVVFPSVSVFVWLSFCLFPLISSPKSILYLLPPPLNHLFSLLPVPFFHFGCSSFALLSYTIPALPPPLYPPSSPRFRLLPVSFFSLSSAQPQVIEQRARRMWLRWSLDGLMWLMKDN